MNYILLDTMPNFLGDKPFGWVKKVNPDNLEGHELESPNLECGEHIWCECYCSSC